MKKFIFSFILIFAVLTSIIVMPASAYTLPAGKTIHAFSVLLENVETGQIIFEKNADERIYPASITKLMTAIVTVETVKDLNATVTAYDDVINDLLGTGASNQNIKPGEQMTVTDLLYCLLVPSGCDAANVLAEYVAGSKALFYDLMNQKAAQLGMTSSQFVNAHGLHDDNQYTTARDLEKLAKEVLKSELLLKICSSVRHTINKTNKSDERVLCTTNLMMDSSSSWYYKRVKGLKTGFTDQAGRCLLSFSEKDDQSYICIVMGCPPYDTANKEVMWSFDDTETLLYWAYSDFSYTKVASKGQFSSEVGVTLCSESDFVRAITNDELYAIIPNNTESTIVLEPHLTNKTLEAPIKQGDKLGYVIVKCAGQELGRIDLVAENSCERSTVQLILNVVKKGISSPWFLIPFGVIIGLIAILIIVNIVKNMRRRRLWKAKVKNSTQDK